MSPNLDARIWVALALLGACGAAPANIHDTYQTGSQIYCEAEFRCCSAAQAQAKSGVSDASKCAQSVNVGFNATAAVIQTAIDKGLYSFNPSAAALCLDGVRGGLSSCAGSSYQIDIGANPVCSAVVLGTLQPGAHCNSVDYGGGCAPGSYCTAGGTCQLYAKSGEDCSGTNCSPGLVCLSSIKCGSPLDDAQPCTAPAQCKSGACVASACAPTLTVAQKICN